MGINTDKIYWKLASAITLFFFFVGTFFVSSYDISLYMKADMRDGLFLENLFERTSKDPMYAQSMVYCMSLEEGIQKDSCLDNIIEDYAFSYTDTFLCGAISDTNRKQECVDTIVYNQALQEDTGLLCDSIKDHGKRDQCLFRFSSKLAKENRDSSFCSSIPDSPLRDNCLRQVRYL
ncbi:MAG: hypothetical protein U9Q15_03690 [Patescibacteria group bacterium]|nr:hypothetical protein [Patescibacteria group bacterium]